MWEQEKKRLRIYGLLYAVIKPKKVKLATVAEGDLKPPFSTATTPRCMGGL